MRCWTGVYAYILQESGILRCCQTEEWAVFSRLFMCVLWWYPAGWVEPAPIDLSTIKKVPGIGGKRVTWAKIMLIPAAENGSLKRGGSKKKKKASSLSKVIAFNSALRLCSNSDFY